MLPKPPPDLLSKSKRLGLRKSPKIGDRKSSPKAIFLKRQMVKNSFFTGQQVAQRLGISKQTLFRYEKKGVFPKPTRSVINRWRQYNEDDIKRLQDIIRKSIQHG